MDGNNRQESFENISSTGWVFNVQRYAIHDGPGIRTTVFLKGCPLACLWCDNPESQSPRPQVFFWEDRCIHCGYCLTVCPTGAILGDAQARKEIDTEHCNLCGLCTEQCFAGALEQVGSQKTVDEIMGIVLEDQPFYDESGGGMTLSGGEPLAQPQFAFQLLKTAHEHGIHTAIETSGFGSWQTWENLLPYLDLILYDLKEVTGKQHKKFIGVSNELILDNLRRLAQTGKPIIIRRPVIPGYNDAPESIHILGQFVKQLETIHEIDLLPYHRLGQKKYEHLGRDYVLGDTPTMKDEEVAGLRDILLSYGFRVKVGG